MVTGGLICQLQFPMSPTRATRPDYLITLQIIPDIYHEDKVSVHVTCKEQISAVGAVGLLPALCPPSPTANSARLQTTRLNESSVSTRAGNISVHTVSRGTNFTI